MSTASLGRVGRQFAGISQDEGQVSRAGQIPLQAPARPMDMPQVGRFKAKNFEASYSASVYIPPVPTRNQDWQTIIGRGARAKNLDVGRNGTINIPLQLPNINQILPTLGQLRAKNFEASYSQSVYIPLQVPHFNYDFPNVGLLKAKNIEASGNGTASIPLQLPNINTILPTIGRLKAKNLDPQRNYTAYVPLQIPNLNHVLPTLGRLYAKNIEASQNTTIYVRTLNGIYTPYQLSLELPNYYADNPLPEYSANDSLPYYDNLERL